MKRATLSTFLVLFCIILAFTHSLADQPKYGGMLVLGYTQDPTGLDPVTFRGDTSQQVITNIFDALVRYKTGTFEIEPALAESWNVSKDGLVYTFHLRKGVKFHDGTPFDAQAVFENVDRILNKENPHHPGSGMSLVGLIYGEVANYKVIDKSTFQFTLKNPYAPFLACLAMTPAAVVSPDAIKKHGKDIFKNPVGTGPFVFKEWIKGDHVTLTANKDYWDGRPYLDSLVCRVIPETSVALIKLEKGEIQLLPTVSPEHLERIKKNKDLRLYETDGQVLCSIGINHIKKPLDDVRVRRALSHAINREELCKYILVNADPIQASCPKKNWAYYDGLKGYPYNPEKAKQLLAEAGYPKGFDVEFTVRSTAGPINPGGLRTWEAVQTYWQAIGVNAKLRVLEHSAFYNVVLSGKNEWELEQDGWTSDNGDPDEFLYQRFHSKSWLNFFNYKNTKADELLAKARQVTKQEERIPYYREAQKIIIDEDCARIELASLKIVWASSVTLKNFKPAEKTYEHLARVWLD